MKVTLPTHAKTYALADRMGWTVAEAVGTLAILWNYCKQYSRDGDLSKLTPTHLARMLGRSPSEGNGIFAGLAETGWIDPHPYTEGGFVVHDWLEHCEGYIIRDLGNAGRLDADGRKTPPDRLYSPETGSALQRTAQHCTALHSTAQQCSPSPSPSLLPSPSLSHTPSPSPPRGGRAREAKPSPEFDAWWRSYPVRGNPGKRGHKQAAWDLWQRLTDQQREKVPKATARLIASGQLPKDAERFLRPPRGSKTPEFETWLEDTTAAPVAGTGKSAVQRKEAQNHDEDYAWLTESK